jgi:hypothetical protein
MEILFSNIINNIKNSIINPEAFWVAKKDGFDTQKSLLMGFLVPIIFVVAIGVFVGDLFRRSDFVLEIPLLNALLIVILFSLQYLISVFFTNELIKTFGGKKDIAISRNLVAYSMTPLLLIYIVTSLIPFLGILNVLGFYGFYIFWIGVNETLEFPEDKKSSYTIIAIVVNFFVFSFLSITLSKLLTAYY